MLILQPNEVCTQYNCPCQKDPSSAGYCQGLNPNRSNKFECSYVNESGMVNCSVCRSPFDKSGKAVLLQE